MRHSPEHPSFGEVKTIGDSLLDKPPRRRHPRVKIAGDKTALAENPLQPKENNLPDKTNGVVIPAHK